MKILLTNDDGYAARGIAAMREALVASGHEVIIVAPETEMSAVGHAITLADPLRVRDIHDNGHLCYAVDGTPADCVKIAIKALLDVPPDLVVSGVNHGQNVATNVIYSGTVSAATEGVILGVPSIAISLASFTSTQFSAAALHGARIADRVIDKGMPPDTLLNINVPDLPEAEIRGVKVCRMGASKFQEIFERRVDPRGRDYYWQSGGMNVIDADRDADISLLDQGFVTVTPIHFDLTAHDFLPTLETWDL